MIGLVKAFVWVFPLKRIYNAPQDKGIQPRGLEIITQPFHEDLSNFFQLCQHTPMAGIHLSPRVKPISFAFPIACGRQVISSTPEMNRYGTVTLYFSAGSFFSCS
jgi:hypothetical protein